jgi:hypothetical protein
MLLIFISGMAAPAMLSSGMGRTLPLAPASSRTGCWPVGPAVVYPTATMVPAGATVAPTTDSVAASPSGQVGSQAVPLPVAV